MSDYFLIRVQMNYINFSNKYSSILPPLSTTEYQQLKADINQRGILIPIIIDEHKNIIDGQHRLSIAKELGLSDIPFDIRIGLSEDEKQQLAIDLNLHRRHLSKEQRKEWSEKLKQQGFSNRIIADKLGVSEPTVRRDVKSGASNDAPQSPEKVTGKDGKQYPAKKEVTETNNSTDTIEKPIEDIPHVAKNTGVSEWFTPLEYIDAAKKTMGSIDIDPASCKQANDYYVKAEKYFDLEIDGLKQIWNGNVWMNPPYAQPGIVHFSKTLVKKYLSNEIYQACVLVNNATDTNWFQIMLFHCQSVCFVNKRIRFLDVNGNPGAPLQGQAILYFGNNKHKFKDNFSKFGTILNHA